jgi:hypothetical protein
MMVLLANSKSTPANRTQTKMLTSFEESST